jgi:ATP synthase F1 delta subunit
LNKNEVAKKYSRALMSSEDISRIPGVVEELKAFSGLIESNRQMKLLFAGQIFSEHEKGLAYNALLPLLKLSTQTEKFLKLIILQGHLSALKEVIIASINAYNERQKKATAVVISPVTIDKSYAERLKAALKKLTKREIEIESEIDPSLLGGFIVKVGSTIYDSSIKGQLRLLKAELMR